MADDDDSVLDEIERAAQHFEAAAVLYADAARMAGELDEAILHGLAKAYVLNSLAQAAQLRATARLRVETGKGIADAIVAALREYADGERADRARLRDKARDGLEEGES